MKDNYNNEPKKKGAKGRKAMLIIGIIILNISLFLAAFVFSFNLIINPVEKRDTQIQTLSDENKKLKNDSQLLKDQLEVVESELESYKERYGSSGSSSKSGSGSTSRSGSSSSSKRSDDSDESEDSEDSRDSESRASERSSSDSGSREESSMNMDND